MEQELKYEEWYFQSDYDLETAQYMLQAERNIYCIFMCHLSLEKALKGLFIKRLNQIPPKIHNLLYFVEILTLEPEETHLDFLISINQMSITTRYAEDLRGLIKLYPLDYTKEMFKQTKAIQQWIKNQ